MLLKFIHSFIEDSKKIKTDFDGDDFVGGDDLRHIINSIAKNDNEKLKKEEIIHIIKSVFL